MRGLTSRWPNFRLAWLRKTRSGAKPASSGAISEKVSAVDDPVECATIAAPVPKSNWRRLGLFILIRDSREEGSVSSCKIALTLDLGRALGRVPDARPTQKGHEFMSWDIFVQDVPAGISSARGRPNVR